MKAMLNGALNCSILDGWWAEGYNGENGWAIGGEAERSDAVGDAEDAEALYATLEQGVVPLYYQRDAAGLPAGWIARVRESLKSLGPVFNTERMVAEYATEIY
jgi:starch phosphorylase